MSNEEIGLVANVATVVALVPTFVALFFTAYQLSAGRRASSAAALISLNESLRQSWLHFKNAAEPDDKQYTFSDVVNLLEIACATRADGLFVGECGKIMEQYLIDILQTIQNSDIARASIEAMLGGHPGTFKNILTFLCEHPQIKIKLPGA